MDSVLTTITGITTAGGDGDGDKDIGIFEIGAYQKSTNPMIVEIDDIKIYDTDPGW